MKVTIELTNEECRRALAKYLVEERGLPADPEDVTNRVYLFVSCNGDSEIVGRLAIETSESFSQGPYR